MVAAAAGGARGKHAARHHATVQTIGQRPRKKAQDAEGAAGRRGVKSGHARPPLAADLPRGARSRLLPLGRTPDAVVESPRNAGARIVCAERERGTRGEHGRRDCVHAVDASWTR
ncbi:hypothetical protein MRX96_030555 [Rhipicephalus microplus]